ncbi:MAG TPA: hypothetical protein VF198_13245 [Vicinamibacterales bacterium]
MGTNPVLSMVLYVVGGLLLAGILMALLVPVAGGRIGPGAAAAMAIVAVLGGILLWSRGRSRAR